MNHPLAAIALAAALIAPAARAQEPPPPPPPVAPDGPTDTAELFDVEDYADFFEAIGVLEEGDRILAINGTKLDPKGGREIYEKLKGARKFTLEIERPGKGAQTVVWELPEGIETLDDYDPEIEGMIRELKLTADEAKAVRTILAESQAEFARRMAELKSSKPDDLMKEVERIGEELYKRTTERMAQAIAPERRAAFQEYMKRKEAEERDEER